MVRYIIGCVAAALAMFIISFVFYSTPLGGLAYATVSDAANASVQNALAANLPSTGTYMVPWPNSAEGTVLYGRGPVATVHYNLAGFALADPGVMVRGLIHIAISISIFGLGLYLLRDKLTDFISRARFVICAALGAMIFAHLGAPIRYHHDWTYALYHFFADFMILAGGGLVLARWFIADGQAHRQAVEG